MPANKNTVIGNMLWRFAERCGAQGVSFLVSLVLARLLMPEEYGVVSLITIFTTILNLFMDAGFKNALIQKKNADQTDYSTVFYFNIFMGLLLYLGMFAAAPAISRFYGMEMTLYIRVLSLTLVMGGINGVQSAYVAKRMEFRRFFYATLCGTGVSPFTGIRMACGGYGVWALIAQRLSNQAINILVLWFTVRWRPSFVFSFDRLKPMFHYGSRILGSSLLDSLTSNLTSLIIGKMYPADTLGYYDKGQRLPRLVVENLQMSVQSVLFPVIAERQENRDKIKQVLRRSYVTSAYCIFPCMAGIAVCAEPIVRILYTEKWISMVPYVQVWCFIYAFYLLHTADLQVIQAVGRSDIFLKIEVIKQILSLAGILIAIPFGVMAMMLSMCAVTVISLYINARPNQELAGYGFTEHIKDIVPVIVLNIFMALAVSAAGKLPLPDMLLLAVQILTGAAVYTAGSVLLRMDSFLYIKETAGSFIRRRGK